MDQSMNTFSMYGYNASSYVQLSKEVNTNFNFNLVEEIIPTSPIGTEYLEAYGIFGLKPS